MSKCDMCGIEGKALYSRGSQSVSAFGISATVCSPCINRAVILRLSQHGKGDMTEHERV